MVSKKIKFIIASVAFVFVTVDIVVFQLLISSIIGLQYSKELLGISLLILISFGWGVTAVLVIQYIYNKLRGKGVEKGL